MKKNTCLRAKNTWRSKIILHHRDSKEFRKLKARLKLLRVVRLGIYARRKTGQQLLPHGRCAEPGGHEGGIPTDLLYRLAERYGLIGVPQASLHTAPGAVQSLHWAFQSASEQKKKLNVLYLDFAKAFNSVDHAA